VSEERFVDIESKIAFQENTISELNEAILRQQKEIAQLGKQVEALSENQKSMSEVISRAGEGDPREEKPPHY